MPVFFLDRLPLPNLKVYTAVSVLLLSCSVYYAIQVTTQPGYSRNATVVVDVSNNDLAVQQSTALFNIDDVLPDDSTTDDDVNLAPDFKEVHDGGGGGSCNESTKEDNEPRPVSLADVLYYLIEEPLCIWTLINMAYCCLILIGKVIQKIVFGELRVSEQQHMKDKFWNFVFYKFIFIFGVMNVQFMDEVVLWCSWFSVLGFLHLLAQLSKDRFQYLSFSPTMPKWTHVRLLSLLVCILITSSFLLSICVFVGLHAGINTFAFMGAECVLLILRTLFVIARYAIHLWDMNYFGVWEKRGTYVYYTELIFELTAAFTDLLHHAHMLLWSNIFLSMASLVICMQIRYLSYEIKRRFKKHKNYLRVIQHMQQNYPMGTTEELAVNSDDCAICWDKMESARKLPCGHLFHNSCLQSWLEQDTSCPTCRTSLANPAEANRRSQRGNAGGRGEADQLETLEADRLPGTPIAAVTRANRTTTNHFFHFDASRYVSWLPSFSVEVTHTQLLHRQTQMQTSQLDNMAWQVQQLFPQMPLNTIQDDLRTTRSVDATVDNILEERLVAPPFQMQGARMAMNSHEIPQASQTNQDLLRDNIDPIGASSSNVVQETSHASSSRTNDVQDIEAITEETRLPPKADVDNVNLSEPFVMGGGRFSKSSQERERMLANRKDELVRQAKRRYVSKLFPGESNSSSSSSSNGQQRAKDEGESEASTEGDAESRRYRAYKAACRRLKYEEEHT